MQRSAFEKAVWIWRQGAAGNDEYCDFSESFEISDTGSYRLRIAADSNYTVYINGALAAFGQYADYPTYKVYDEVDVTKFVRDGLNRMVTVVWYHGADTQTYRRGEAGVIYELACSNGSVVLASSEKTLSRLSKDYEQGRCSYISGQLGFTYHYDMRAYDGFIENDVSGFAPSREVTGISYDLSPRPNKKLLLCDRMAARICMMGNFRYTTSSPDPSQNMQFASVAFRYKHQMMRAGSDDFSVPAEIYVDESDKSAEGIFFIVDLGEESAGFLDLDIEVPEACPIEIGYGEHLADGRCRTSIRGFFCDFYAKAGRNKYMNTFRRFGCRYIQLFIHSPSAKVYYAGLRPTVYPLKAKEYKSGNLLRDTVYRVSQNTLIQCLHEHYEDCPWREQALYTMDSRNQMLCGYYAFGEYEAPRAALKLISNGVRSDGLLDLCYPAGTNGTIPSFSCVYFIQMEEYIRYSGDTSLAAECYGMMTTLIDAFLAKMQPEGVIDNFYGGKGDYWNFYEWTPTMSGSFCESERRLEAPINAYLSLALQSFARICDAIGNGADAQKYREKAAELNGAIARVFYDEEQKLFDTFDKEHKAEHSVLTQALCLLCGAAEGLDTSRILRVLESNGCDSDGLVVHPNTLSMNSFRFDALLAVDREKYAKVILDEIDGLYLHMLRSGATTFWETIYGEADFGGAGSLCHGWSALPIYYYELLNG